MGDTLTNWDVFTAATIMETPCNTSHGICTGEIGMIS